MCYKVTKTAIVAFARASDLSIKEAAPLLEALEDSGCTPSTVYNAWLIARGAEDTEEVIRWSVVISQTGEVLSRHKSFDEARKSHAIWYDKLQVGILIKTV